MFLGERTWAGGCPCVANTFDVDGFKIKQTSTKQDVKGLEYAEKQVPEWPSMSSCLTSTSERPAGWTTGGPRALSTGSADTMAPCNRPGVANPAFEVATRFFQPPSKPQGKPRCMYRAFVNGNRCRPTVLAMEIGEGRSEDAVLGRIRGRAATEAFFQRW